MFIDEIREAIDHMKARFVDGQGGFHSAMCRLSLPMSIALRSKLEAALALLAESRDLGVSDDWEVRRDELLEEVGE
jgi:hypothetical protein